MISNALTVLSPLHISSKLGYFAQFTSYQTWCFPGPGAILFFLSGPQTQLQNWSSLVYVDVSESPVLTAKWQQAPSHFGVQKYRVQVFNKVDGSEMNLQASEVIPGTNKDHELSYKFDGFRTSGDYHFEVCILSDNCTDSLCKVSKSPDVTVCKYNGLNYRNFVLCHK
jgi:hypothetical protein